MTKKEQRINATDYAEEVINLLQEHSNLPNEDLLLIGKRIKKDLLKFKKQTIMDIWKVIVKAENYFGERLQDPDRTYCKKLGKYHYYKAEQIDKYDKKRWEILCKEIEKITPR